MLHAPDEAENEPRRDQHCHRTACRADCGNPLRGAWLWVRADGAGRGVVRTARPKTPPAQTTDLCGDFLADPRVQPLPPLPKRASCRMHRATDAARGYCNTHYQRWRNALAADPDLDTQQWQARESPVAEPGRVNLRGRCRCWSWSRYWSAYNSACAAARGQARWNWVLCDGLRSRQVDSITTDRAEITRNKIVRALRTTLTQRVRRLADPDSEQIKDTWDLAVFGHHGSLSFAGISQPWLAQSVKQCAVQQLPRHRGRGAARVRTKVNGIRLLSGVSRPPTRWRTRHVGVRPSTSIAFSTGLPTSSRSARSADTGATASAGTYARSWPPSAPSA